MSQAFVQLDRLGKSYGPVPAVIDLSLDIAQGEALTLLGPSGCGKTTTLRMVAGLEKPDAGAIRFGGKPVVSIADRINLPPEKRNIGMVFQSYAIWPHMTVAQNVGFPLKVRRVDAATIRERVRKALAMIGLGGLEDRPATRLSGGQQQRVALARALIHEPALLLLDEPLSNLDVKLREQMRIELKLLQARLGLTLIYVTHDQSEALSLSDRIVVLNRGRIEQIGAPRTLYEQPATPFVRDFLGKSITLPGRVKSIAAGRAAVELGAHNDALIDCPMPPALDLAAGREVDISLRPEAIHLANGPLANSHGAALDGIVEAVLYQGERSECEVKIGGSAVTIYLPPGHQAAPGDKIALAIEPDAARLWAKPSGAP
ncbi:MAG TPA: ABC transporter ATP-binding protein [Stellaceae bacterium]|nr:ABC transporter ATP-binding protein [Stellaceae bacterium]